MDHNSDLIERLQTSTPGLATLEVGLTTIQLCHFTDMKPVIDGDLPFVPSCRLLECQNCVDSFQPLPFDYYASLSPCITAVARTPTDACWYRRLPRPI
jgi:hypothetical protein